MHGSMPIIRHDEETGPAPLPENPALPETSGALSNLARSLLARVGGIEALAEGLLQQASDAELPQLVYLLHDVLIRDKSPAQQNIFFYFDQPKQQIDEAIGLFRMHRKRLCARAKAAADEYPLLQLYLLYDCLVQAGSLARRCRQIAYLAKRPDYKWRMGLAEFLETAETGQLFNFAVVQNNASIGPSHRYHSEIAAGQPAQAVGQIIKIAHKDGSLSILISNETGHYKVPFISIHKMIQLTGDALAERYPEQQGDPASRPRIILCPGKIQAALTRMA